mmetsp:Transcript_37283/g.96310  ORF Transcript_37283/g.96310 Transcript_37283/m.96310 type:complete len:475 (-) Transcript_37283:71-1495(-)
MSLAWQKIKSRLRASFDQRPRPSASSAERGPGRRPALPGGSVEHADLEAGLERRQPHLDLRAGLDVEVDDDVAGLALRGEELLADVGPRSRQRRVDLGEHAGHVLVHDENAVRLGGLRQVDLGEVHGAVRAALVDQLDERGGNLLADLGLRLLGRAAHVGRHQCVRAPAELRLEQVLTVLAWLLREDIHIGAAQVPGFQRCRESGDHDHVAAARVQQARTLLHLLDLCLAHHVLRRGEVRNMQGDKVRGRQELFQGCHLRCVAHGQLGDHVVVDHLHAHSLCEHGHLRANVAVADKAEGLAADLEATNRLLEPSATVHGRSALADLARQPDDVADDEFGDAPGVREGRVENRDALLLRRRQVHLVSADAEAGNCQQPVARLDHLLGDLGLAADAQDVQVLDLLEELGLGERRLERLHREALVLQHLDAVGRHSLQEEDLNLVLGVGDVVRRLRPLGIGRHSISRALLADRHHGV